MKKQELIEFTIPTDPELSIIIGRNGTYRINQLRIWESHDRTHVYMDGIGKRGVAIKGGLFVTLECFANACRQFLDEYARHMQTKVEIPAAADRCDRAADEEADGLKTVRGEWNMRCPQCNRDEAIEVNASTFVRVLPEGTDPSDVNGDLEWDNGSAAICTACGFSGTVRDFEIAEKGSFHEV